MSFVSWKRSTDSYKFYTPDHSEWEKFILNNVRSYDEVLVNYEYGLLPSNVNTKIKKAIISQTLA